MKNLKKCNLKKCPSHDRSRNPGAGDQSIHQLIPACWRIITLLSTWRSIEACQRIITTATAGFWLNMVLAYFLFNGNIINLSLLISEHIRNKSLGSFLNKHSPNIFFSCQYFSPMKSKARSLISESWPLIFSSKIS